MLRYHLGEPIDRGTIAVQPLTAGGPASIEFKTYAAAVQGQLLQAGYSVPAPGAKPLLVATVGFTRTTQAGPPKQSPISIGIGGGGLARQIEAVADEIGEILKLGLLVIMREDDRVLLLAEALDLGANVDAGEVLVQFHDRIPSAARLLAPVP